jgi:hypothetical protein
MRAAATALAGLALALAPAAAAGMSDWATASQTGTTLSLRLHYPMTCGQPGRGPLVVTLPTAFRVTGLHVTVQGAQQTAALGVSTLTIDVPKPPQVTCMSITEGTLPVTIAHVHADAGSYTVHAKIRNHVFTARLRIP